MIKSLCEAKHGGALVCPGDVIAKNAGDASYVPGHGVYVDYGNQSTSSSSSSSSSVLRASIAGTVCFMNRLVYVRSFHEAYNAKRVHAGDVVVGRVASVDLIGKKWLVDVGAPKLAQLHLGSINLIGNEQRCRNEQD